VPDQPEQPGPDQHDLAVPVYVDTSSLLDLLASLEGGFSMVERFSSHEDTAVSRERATEGAFGVSNVLNLLKLNLSTSRKAGVQASGGSQTEAERYHTYGSLLYRLRTTLDEAGLINRPPDDGTEWESIAPSDFVEIRGVFRPNPLAESLSTVLRILGIVRAVYTVPDKAPGSAKREDKIQADEARAVAMTQIKELEEIEHVLRGVLDDVQSEGARLFVIELAQAPGRSVVARLFNEYARDSTFAELAHGDFKLLGKVVRNLADPNEPGIDLLQGTGMGGMGEEILEELLSGFREAASVGLNLPDIATTVDAPALQVVPIGIYV
jgi:hypothetical protein